MVSFRFLITRFRLKEETFEHIIESIHYVRSKFDNEVSFLLGGDLNRLNIEPILDCYGVLRQIITVPTRKDATLENITHLHTQYHPQTTLPPLQVDEEKKG